MLPFVAATHPEVESADPTRVRVDVSLGEETVSLWLDGDTDVVDYERA